jgi:hypothetical protein
MEIEYTNRYLKDYSNINDKKILKKTDEIIKIIEGATNFIELHKLLDIKKIIIDGTYRIAYNNKPQMRIRFDLISEKVDKIMKNRIKLLFIGTHEEYNRYSHKVLKEEMESKEMTIIITESQFERLLKII